MCFCRVRRMCLGIYMGEFLLFVIVLEHIDLYVKLLTFTLLRSNHHLDKCLIIIMICK